MSTEQNKAVVRRFMMEALSGRNIGVADEVLAPNYVNRMTGADLAGFKAMLTGMSTALSDVRFEIDDLVAEGDSVVARWKMDGNPHRFADGRDTHGEADFVSRSDVLPSGQRPDRGR